MGTSTAVLPERAREREDDRRERVRRALVRAETAVGVRHVDWSAAAAPVVEMPVAGAAAAVSAGEVERAERVGSGGVAGGVVARFDGTWLAVPGPLRDVVPHGAIRRGSSVVVAGSTTVLLHLVAALTAEGAWTAVVSQPELGLAAAVDAGVDPARLVLVPNPGPSAPEVLGAVVDGFDVVVIGRCTALAERDRRAISQRVRHRGAVLLSTQSWPGAEVRLEAVESAWTGLEESGRLTSARIVVAGSGRAAGGARSVALTVSEHDGGTRLGLAPTDTPLVLGAGRGQLGGYERSELTELPELPELNELTELTERRAG